MISSGGMYGAEAVILNLSRTLNEGPHRSMLGVFSNSSNPNLQLHECATKEGIESYLIPCSGQIDRKAITSIRELVQRTDADVVHAHGYKADIYAYFALRSSGVSLVSTCHNWLDNDRKTSFYGVLDPLILRGYVRVVAVSEDVRQRLLKSGVKANKVNMIRNGVDLRPFDRASAVVRHELGWDAYRIVGLVGRLSVEKGVDIFQHAAARVLAHCPDTKFVVAGDGPDRAGLDTLIDKLGICDHVRMLVLLCYKVGTLTLILLALAAVRRYVEGHEPPPTGFLSPARASASLSGRFDPGSRACRPCSAHRELHQGPHAADRA
jgi:glycosyltransferase involved in cell wall biosynthesis